MSFKGKALGFPFFIPSRSHCLFYYANLVKQCCGSVAQWLEQGTHKPKVAGSNPA